MIWFLVDLKVVTTFGLIIKSQNCFVAIPGNSSLGTAQCVKMRKLLFSRFCQFRPVTEKSIKNEFETPKIICLGPFKQV